MLVKTADDDDFNNRILIILTGLIAGIPGSMIGISEGNSLVPALANN